MDEQTNGRQGCQPAISEAGPTGGPLAAARYWHGCSDPLNRRTGSLGQDDGRRMQLAYDTFLSPETARAIKLLGLLEGRRVVVLGCGLGQGALHLAQRGAHVMATDVSPARVALAAQWCAERTINGRLAFRTMSADALELEDDSADCIFSRDVLMYTAPSRVATECARILRPGGRAVFVESLRGGKCMKWLRHRSSPREWEPFTHYLDFAELGTLGGGLQLEQCEGWHLLSTSAFFFLFEWGSPWGYRAALRCFGPIDRQLIRFFPSLQRRAWRGVALYRVGERGENA
ncbi:MAG: class I SAM-dependent methyltransferase [Lentisphaerae bacterium]|nr:class I SAM-dependent methyltransferase [Lentisphaerota bacterium]